MDPSPVCHPVDQLHCPPAVRGAIREFVQAAQQACGELFVALAAHGSLVEGGYAPHRSDANLALCAREFPLAVLERLREPHARAHSDINLSLMLLTPEELERAQDAFPLKFRELARHHVVLAGQEVFREAPVDPADLRLCIEQRARDLQLRTRQMVMARGGRAGVLAGILARAASGSRRLVVDLLEFQGVAVADRSGAALAAHAAAHLDLPAEKLATLWAFHDHDEDGAGRPGVGLVTTALEVLDRLSRKADGLRLSPRHQK